jgi:hypothetical protein
VDATVARVRDVADMLKLLTHTFEERSLAQQELIQKRHQFVFPVALALGDQLYPGLLPAFEQRWANVASISEPLTPEWGGSVRHWCSVIHITGREPEGK